VPQRSGSSNSHLLEQAASYLPALLLILVALSQVQTAWFGDLLTPAKGGGFGLFSTVDKLANRDVRLFVIEASGRELIWAPAELRAARHRRVIHRATSYPTPGNLRVVARRAAALVDEPSIVALRLEVWKKSFDAQSLEVRRIKVADYFLRIDAESS
jgi:hypothetical protein